MPINLLNPDRTDFEKISEILNDPENMERIKITNPELSHRLIRINGRYWVVTNSMDAIPDSSVSPASNGIHIVAGYYEKNNEGVFSYHPSPMPVLFKEIIYSHQTLSKIYAKEKEQLEAQIEILGTELEQLEAQKAEKSGSELDNLQREIDTKQLLFDQLYDENHALLLNKYKASVEHEYEMLQASGDKNAALIISDRYPITSFLQQTEGPGKPLDLFINDNPNLSLDERLTIIKKIIEAVDNLHERGIAHLDLKLENILYDKKKNIITLIDWGSAESIHFDLAAHESLQVKTTPEFNPEDYHSRSPIAVDNYSLVGVIGEVLYGKTGVFVPEVDPTNLTSVMHKKQASTYRFDALDTPTYATVTLETETMSGKKVETHLSDNVVLGRLGMLKEALRGLMVDRSLEAGSHLLQAFRKADQLRSQGFIPVQEYLNTTNTTAAERFQLATQIIEAIKRLHTEGRDFAINLNNILYDKETDTITIMNVGPAKTQGVDRPVALDMEKIKHVLGQVIYGKIDPFNPNMNVSKLIPNHTEDIDHLLIAFQKLNTYSGLGYVPLEEYINSNKELTVSERVSLAKKITEAVKLLHDNGIYHGDIHAKNILYDKATDTVIIMTSGPQQKIDANHPVEVDNKKLANILGQVFYGEIDPFADDFDLHRLKKPKYTQDSEDVDAQYLAKIYQAPDKKKPLVRKEAEDLKKKYKEIKLQMISIRYTLEQLKKDKSTHATDDLLQSIDKHDQASALQHILNKPLSLIAQNAMESNLLIAALIPAFPNTKSSKGSVKEIYYLLYPKYNLEHQRSGWLAFQNGDVTIIDLLNRAIKESIELQKQSIKIFGHDTGMDKLGGSNVLKNILALPPEIKKHLNKDLLVEAAQHSKPLIVKSTKNFFGALSNNIFNNSAKKASDSTDQRSTKRKSPPNDSHPENGKNNPKTFAKHEK